MKFGESKYELKQNCANTIYPAFFAAGFPSLLVKKHEGLVSIRSCLVEKNNADISALALTAPGVNSA